MEQLCATLAATLDPDKQLRNNAETALKQGENTAGFGMALFQIVSSREVGVATRHAGSIYLKHLVERKWSEHFNEGERAAIRDNIVSAAVNVEVQSIRVQLGLVLKTVADQEFPGAWPGFVTSIMACMSSGESANVYGGLFLLEILSKMGMYFRKQPKEDGGVSANVLEQFVAATLPMLTTLYQQILASGSFTTETGMMLKLVVKTYWSYTNSATFPACVADPASFNRWQEMLLQTLLLRLPDESQPTDSDERIAWSWWKAKKWAAHIQQRMLQVFDGGSGRAGSVFNGEHAVATTQTFLQVLQLKQQGIYVTSRLLNVALTSIVCAIGYAATFAVLKPHIAELISVVVFPFMCLNDEDEALWNNDPEEYVRRQMDIMVDVHSPASAASMLIKQLVRNRTKSSLQICLDFLSQALAQYAAAGNQNYRVKYGAMSMIISLKEKLLDPSYHEQVAFMLLNHVVPEFQSPKGLLRAQACSVCSEFADFAGTLCKEGNSEIFNLMLQGVVTSLQDSDSPVRIDAATALGSFMESEDAVAKLKPSLPKLLEVLFEMINSAGNEASRKVDHMSFSCFDDFDGAWKKFDAHVGTKQAVRHTDIPWPTCLPSISRVEPKDTAAERKKKLRAALIRWHPDKWGAIFDLVSDCDKVLVMSV